MNQKMRARLKKCMLIGALAVLGGMIAIPAQGATFTVNSTVDELDTNPGDGVCAAASGQCTLRAAIQEANALTGADNVTLPAGTYRLTIDGRDEDGAATGDLDITDDLSISGADAASTIIDADARDRVFHAIDTSVDIGGVTIQNGAVSGTPFQVGNGGGIQCLSSTMTLTNVAISGNTAEKGGGIWVTNASSVTLTDSMVSGNSAAGNGGGIDSNGSIAITRTTVSGNTAGYAGAIFINGTMTLTDSTVNNNTRLVAIAIQGTGVLTNCTISDNTGSGIIITAAVSANAAITNCTISGNTGGGISNLRNATITNGRLLSRENRRHGKKMSFYFLFMPRIAVGSNALVGRSRYAAEKKLK